MTALMNAGAFGAHGEIQQVLCMYVLGMESCCSIEPSTASFLTMGMKVNFDNTFLVEEGSR